MNGRNLSPEERALRAREAQRRMLLQLLRQGSPAIRRTMRRTRYPGEGPGTRAGAALFSELDL